MADTALIDGSGNCLIDGSGNALTDDLVAGDVTLTATLRDKESALS
jgi:hypothetical protein